MTQSAPIAGADIAKASVEQTIAHLAQNASIEINVQDVPSLRSGMELLKPAKKMYVSHLPKQSWSDTIAACAGVRIAGFIPVPHVPVRLLDSTQTLDDLLRDFTLIAGVEEVLLIAGDYANSVGPYSSAMDVLQSGMFDKHGIVRVSLAGHPEGHPKVALDEIRRAEREKVTMAARSGLDVTLLTQFFFEAQPFLDWAHRLRAQELPSRIVAGLAGPASLTTLFRFAMRCGVGPSIRALGARPSSLLKLSNDHGPEPVVRELADASRLPDSPFDGIHLFCFGGFLRTCRWLDAVAQGRFAVDRNGRFAVAM